MNLGIIRRKSEIYASVDFGVAVQFLVLVLAAFSAYYSRWDIEKVGATVQKYSFPFTALGTILLGIG